jgi:hypothetical protein
VVYENELEPGELQQLPIAWQQNPGNSLMSDDHDRVLTEVRSLINQNRAAVLF